MTRLLLHLYNMEKLQVQPANMRADIPLGIAEIAGLQSQLPFLQQQ